MNPEILLLIALVAGLTAAGIVPPGHPPGPGRTCGSPRRRRRPRAAGAPDASRRGAVRGALAAGLAVLLAPGCVSIRLETAPEPRGRWETGTVEVKVYETPGDRRRGVVTRRPILTELFVLDDRGQSRPLHWSSETSWTISAVEEGRYVLRVRSWVDPSGERHPLGSTGRLAFFVARGANVRISVVMRSAAQAAENVVFGVAAVGVIALCAHEPADCLND